MYLYIRCIQCVYMYIYIYVYIYIYIHSTGSVSIHIHLHRLSESTSTALQYVRYICTTNKEGTCVKIEKATSTWGYHGVDLFVQQCGIPPRCFPPVDKTCQEIGVARVLNSLFRHVSPTDTLVAQGSLAQSTGADTLVRFWKVPVQWLGWVSEGCGADNYPGQDPEGSGTEVRWGSGGFRSRYLGQVLEGSGADAEVRFQTVPVQRLGQVPRVPVPIPRWGSGKFRCRKVPVQVIRSNSGRFRYSEVAESSAVDT